ncbi:hypothetical protein VNO80_03636 [Phaseolus coccineus]|uniref:Uncharacterized protein n=1 Tax=Phaseolus coccineus TaxID=3886 RepID=A0AAN9RRR1_PHACN
MHRHHFPVSHTTLFSVLKRVHVPAVFFFAISLSRTESFLLEKCLNLLQNINTNKSDNVTNPKDPFVCHHFCVW